MAHATTGFGFFKNSAVSFSIQSASRIQCQLAGGQWVSYHKHRTLTHIVQGGGWGLLAGVNQSSGWISNQLQQYYMEKRMSSHLSV